MADDIATKQLETLKEKLNSQAVKQREVGGGFKADYLEGWYVIEAMNHIFGFDGWSGEVQSIELISGGQAYCVYKVTVKFANGHLVTKTGVGHGDSKITGNMTEVMANGNALKEAETDAMKRACRYLGNKFGNSLYDKEKRGVE